MSRVNSAPASAAAPAAVPSQAPAVAEPAASTAPMVSEETSLFSQDSTASSLSEIHTKNIVVDTSMTATELSLGKTMKLSENLPSVFGVNEASPNIIITGISLENVYSDVPQRVQVGASLFDNAQLQHQHLKNEQGWLYAATSTELDAAEHTPMLKSNFTNLVSILPFEQQRHTNVSLYTPASSSLNSRMLQEYGGIQSREQLMQGCVSVTDTCMYVPSSSVLCRVISRNWDRFGFHPDQEAKVESEFYRIDTDVVNSVADQLWTKVCSRFPFTDTHKNFKLHLQSPVQPSNSVVHNVSFQLKVDYRLPLADTEQ